MTATRSWRPTSSWPRPRGCWRCRWSPPSITARCWESPWRRWPNWCNRPSRKCTSSAREPGFEGWLPAARKTVLVTGCEAHICVLQTVIGLTELGYRAVLVSDAAGSRKPSDHHAALRARAWRGYRHHRNGDLRVDGNLRAPALSRRVTSGQIAAPAATLSPGNAKIISLFDTIPGQTSQRRGEYFAILRAPTQEGSARSQPAGSSAFPGTRTGVPS